MVNRSPVMNMMVRAAEAAAKGLVRDFGELERLQVSRKGQSDFVSIADKRAEEIIHAELSKARPNAGFLMEEGTAEKTRDGSRFIVDPLDGTHNFLRGVPHWAISIGLEINGELTHGVIYDPIKDEMFTAERGGGAYVNRHRLRVSGRQDLLEAMIGIGWEDRPHAPEDARAQPERAVRLAGAVTRRFGSAALDLAYVAAGRYDGFFEFGLSPWDCAAGVVLVREAGGYATDITGKPDAVFNKSLVCGNTKVHGQLLKVVTKAMAAASRKATPGD